MPVNPLYTNSDLNFKFDKISNFVPCQVPAFVRTEGSEFVDFVKAYYDYLESKNIAIVVSSLERLVGDIQAGDTVASVHCLMAEDGVTYIGGFGIEDGEEHLLELDSFRNNEFEVSSITGFVLYEKVIVTSSGASAYINSIDPSNKTLKLGLIEGEFAYNDIIVGQESGAYSTIVNIDNSLQRPSSIYGLALGGIDIDTDTEGVLVPRKKIVLNHLSGAIERFLTEEPDLVGELYNGTILNSINYYTIEISRFDANTSFDFIVGEHTLGYYANNELTGREGTIYEIISETGDNKTIKIINHKGESKNISYYIVGQESGAKALLNSVTAPALPRAFTIEELETPIYAYNNIHNWGDIDYVFNNKMFLGSDYYTYFANEIMKDWPVEIVYPAEQYIKNLIARNIKDFYRSKGTEDSIKFLFKIIFGKEAELYYPSERIFSLNDGRWETLYNLNVEIDGERNVLDAIGRRIYNSANTSYHGLIEGVEENIISENYIDYVLIPVSYEFDGETFEHTIAFANNEIIQGEFANNQPTGSSSLVSSWISSINVLRVNVNETEGSFVIGDIIHGGTSDAYGEIISVNSNSTNIVERSTDTAHILISDVYGSFGIGDSITGELINAEEFTCSTTYEIFVKLETDNEYRALKTKGCTIYNSANTEIHSLVKDVWKESILDENNDTIFVARMILENISGDITAAFNLGDIIHGTIDNRSYVYHGTISPSSNVITDIWIDGNTTPIILMSDMSVSLFESPYPTSEIDIPSSTTIINIDGVNRVTLSNEVTGNTSISNVEVDIAFTTDFSAEIIHIENALRYTEQYGSNRGVLNGGPMQLLPDGYSEWNDEAARLVADELATDRIQDDEYYQLFSYVVKTDLESNKYDNAKEIIKKLAHPAGFKLFIEPLT